MRWQLQKKLEQWAEGPAGQMVPRGKGMKETGFSDK